MTLIGLFEKCTCGSGTICMYCVQLTLASLAFAGGLFVALRTKARLVGLALAALGFVSFLFVWLVSR